MLGRVPLSNPKIVLNGAEIHRDSRELFVRGEVKRLPWRAFDVLLVLAERPGAVVSKEHLLQIAWQGAAVDESNLTQAVAQIRKVMGEIEPGRSYVETVPRVGYRLAAGAVAPEAPKVESQVPTQPTSAPAARTRNSRLRWTWILAAALSLIAAAAAFSRLPHVRTVASDVVESPFTALEGDEMGGSFSPDGREVVFTWARPNQPSDIYRKAIDSETAQPFVISDADEKGPVFSPDGRSIAFLRMEDDRAAIVIKPSDGGAERVVTRITRPHPAQVASPGPFLAWTRDSLGLIYAHEKSLYLCRLDDGRFTQLTSPPATAARGDADPALSPDGKTLLFVRDISAGAADLYRLPLTPHFEPAALPVPLLVNGNWNRSPAWHPNGHTVVFNSGQWGHQRLWSLDIRNPSSAAPIAGGGLDAQQPAVSPVTGDVLYSRWLMRNHIWSFPLSKPGHAAGPARPLFISTRSDTLQRISRDGSQIVMGSDRSGTFEVWIARSDGSGLRKVTSFEGLPAGSPDLSPDGKTVAFDRLVDGQRDVYLSDLNGGALRRLTTHPADDVIPRWSADGKSVYFCSFRSGRGEIWKADLATGSAIRVTSDGGSVAEESPDGRTLYFTESDSEVSEIFAMPVGGGPARKIIYPIRHRSMSVTAEGIYFISLEHPQEVWFFEFASQSAHNVLTIPQQPVYLAADPSGHFVTVGIRGTPPGDLILMRGLHFP